MKTRTRRVVCWLEEGFDVLDVAAFCQVLSEAGSNWNWRAFKIELASRAGGLVTSHAQLALQTCAIDTCAEPDVAVVANGPNTAAPDAPNPCARWTSPEVEWVGLRAGLVEIVRTGRFAGATVAATPRLQPRLLAAEPTLRFSAKPWHLDAKLWSTSSADATDVALALVQRHVGNSARRAVEASLGLATTFTPVSVGLTKSGGRSES